MPPVDAATAVTNPVSASDDKYMRALVAAGARQKISDQDRHDQPGKSEQFDRARRAADQEIDRERRQRDDAAEQSRRDESAMPRRRQHVLLRRRMDQRFNIITYRREQAHFPIARPALQTRPLFSMAGSCQRPLKRTLRRRRRAGNGIVAGRGRTLAAADSSVMVNRSLPKSPPQLRASGDDEAKSRIIVRGTRRRLRRQSAGTGIRSNFR